MKKVGIATWFNNNYGSVMQAVALRTIIDDLGYESYLINYKAPIKTFSEKRNNINTLLFKLHQKIQYYKITPILSENQRLKFDDFVFETGRISNLVSNDDEIMRLNNVFDAFVCGSDQIWSPVNYDKFYYLSFVENEKKIIAYAPSIGILTFDNNIVKKEMKYYISRFKYISVREKSGKRFIEKLCGKSPEVVLDPTLLLDNTRWLEFANNEYICPSKKYILCYFLGDSKKYNNTIIKLSEHENMDIVVIPFCKQQLNQKNIVIDIGPKEFITLFANASFVLTDSFHGLAFSLIFRKNFSVFKRFRDEDKHNQNTRIYNLLSLLDLDYKVSDASDSIEMILKSIDYINVESRIETMRCKSLDYLKKSLYYATE